MTSSQALSAIVLILQSIPLGAGSYGGVTGLDSVTRGICALVDQTIGPLLFFGLINVSYPDLHLPRSFLNLKLRMARIGFVHTQYDEPYQRRVGVDYRTSWLAIGNTVSHSGYFTVRWTNGGQKTPERLEEGLKMEGLVSFAPNCNQWIYPYLLGAKQPREAGQMVALSRECLIRTAALTIARFGILLASSIILTLFHILVITLLFEDKLIKVVFILGDIGRWMLVVGQLSSVMTYSLDYKGICSWAAPKRYGTRWNRREQIQCKMQVLAYMGKMYHARIVFCAVAWLWCRISPKGSSPRWKDVFGGGGEYDRDIFSSFKCFDKEDFEDKNSTLLCLTVGDKIPGETSIEYRTIYHIDFKVPTQLIESGLNTRLYANPTQRKYNFRIMAPFCICSIIAPFVLIWRDGQSARPLLTPSKSFQTIPQAIWKEAPAQSTADSSAVSGSTRKSHGYSPASQRGTSGSAGLNAMASTSATDAVDVVMRPLEEEDVTEATDKKGKSKAV